MPSFKLVILFFSISFQTDTWFIKDFKVFYASIQIFLGAHFWHLIVSTGKINCNGTVLHLTK